MNTLDQDWKTIRPLHTIIQQHEITILITALESHGRSYAVAAILMGRLGMRVGEVSQLMWQDVDLNGATTSAIKIPESITKTGYARELPLTPNNFQEIWLHREEQQTKYRQEFTEDYDDTHGTSFDKSFVITKPNGKPPSIRTLQLKITNTANQALGYKIKAHTLRHSFATTLMQTANIRVVQAALGHRSIRSTQLYTHPTMNDLKDALTKLDAAT